METRIETIEGVTTTSEYSYDAAGRLDTVTRGGALVADYGYHLNGNRLYEREDLGGDPIATYDDQDRLLSYDFGGTTYSYSAGGDLETPTDAAGTTTYAYDALGNLRRVTFPDGEQIEYGIDGQNRRVGRSVCAAPCSGGATAQPVQGFLYGDGLKIVAELDGSNQVVSRFVYARRVNVPGFMVKGGNTYRIITDHLGSVRLVVDASTGIVAQRIDYDEFGNITQDTSPGFQPFGFAGGLYDPDTGLVRFGARDYDPEVGRWTTKDPIGFGGGLNLYGYVGNDPVNLIDFLGLTTWPGAGNRISGGGGRFGPRTHPITGVADPHQAVDVPNPVGGDVVATDSGTVLWTRQGDGDSANSVTVEHDDLSVAAYSHVRSNLLAGARVEEGQPIGTTDLSGNATAGHVHYQYFEPGTGVVDPTGRLSAAEPYPGTGGGEPCAD